MDITSNFRRKIKYHKPVLVFKELYRDYFKNTKKTSLKHIKSIGLAQNQKNEAQRLKNKSADHLSKYLMKNNPQYFSQTQLRALKHQQSINKTRLSQSRNCTYIFKNLQRSKLQELQKEKQVYFKNTYTSGHPLFNINRNIKQKQISQNPNNPNILPQIFRQIDNTRKTPKDRRLELFNLKQKLNERQKIGRQKFAKVRHNYILQKCYQNKNFQQEQLYIQKFKDHRNISNFSINQFNRTKQNIFPSELALKSKA